LLILNEWVSHTVFAGVFAGVADEETRFILQSAILDRVREAQQSDRLLQQV
jgi:hypothetical protein